MIHQSSTTIYLKTPHGPPHLHQVMHRQLLRRLAYFMFLLFLFSLTSCDNGGVSAQRKDGRTYPLLGAIPQTNFSCRGHAPGYYADPETGCQVYHMCDTLEKQYSYLCPNYTLFNQKFMVCDHWYMVNCSSATDFYDLNEQIGEVPNSKGKEDDANDIKVTTSRKTTPNSRETSSTKDTKFAPVAITFKSTGSSSKPQLPTNSFVTEKTAFAPRVSSPLRPFTLSQTSGASTQQAVKTTERPLTLRKTQQTLTTRVQQTFKTTPRPWNTQQTTARGQQAFKTTPRPQTTQQTSTIRVQQTSKTTPRPQTTQQTSTTRVQQTFKTTPRPQTTQRTSPTRAQQTLLKTTPILQSTQKSPTTRQQQPTTSTPKPITTSKFPQTSRTSFLQTLKPTAATTTRPTFSQTLSTGLKLPTKTTAKSAITIPSRFFELPSVESIFHSIANSSSRVSLPPSVFLQPPHRHSESNSSIEGAKFGAANHTKDHQGHFVTGHAIPFVQTPQPGTPFTMVPGVVARGTGNRFTFSSTHKKPFDEIDFNSIIFRPLVLRPKDKNRKIFTTAPASITLDLHHHGDSGSDQDTQHSTTTVFAAPLSTNRSTNNRESDSTSAPVGVLVPSVLLQPPPIVAVSANVPPFLPAIQQTLIPPPRIKQEFLTPLITPIRTFTQPLLETSRIFPSSRFHFPVSRSNRDFFIPSPGLSLPKEEPVIEDKDTIAELQNVLIRPELLKKTNMTMVFPEPRKIKITTLKINPECPKCHPAFLRPGLCTPCVLIR